VLLLAVRFQLLASGCWLLERYGKQEILAAKERIDLFVIFEEWSRIHSANGELCFTLAVCTVSAHVPMRRRHGGSGTR
jgi:hypothetical protein